jgi:hypothetical protein
MGTVGRSDASPPDHPRTMDDHPRTMDSDGYGAADYDELPDGRRMVPISAMSTGTPKW